ncbi:camphor resistance protein CrcB [Luteitalea pratensis]|uniref:Fluoride-specific ion channel FluC n=1 Tax=Luteitalea pratensis TaxID=1855912 RepID=A0A143PHX4_LUTPR|nr:fluoride efflux transporter CrcB [Luteitalea pratensis]AMY08016.1 camphor resistance protein CrcB [Luteitalea pratensis]
MRSLWLVAVGGALGAVARAMMSTAIHSRWPSTLPWGTIAVNLVGCLILGLLSGALESRPHLNPTWRAFGAVGVLGAFTTFSTFENETLAMLHRGEFPAALVNIAFSVVAGLAAVWVGQFGGRLL